MSKISKKNQNTNIRKISDNLFKIENFTKNRISNEQNRLIEKSIKKYKSNNVIKKENILLDIKAPKEEFNSENKIKKESCSLKYLNELKIKFEKIEDIQEKLNMIISELEKFI